MARLKLDIVTGERVVFSDEVDSVVAPGIEGELGILPRHAPLLTILTVGELRYRRGTEEEFLAIGGGFMEVRPDRVIVLADSAERAEEIDEARAEAARQRAQQALAGAGPADATEITAALRRSLLRLKVARRRPRAPRLGVGEPR